MMKSIRIILVIYFLFISSDIAGNKPLVLSVITGDNKEHHFYFATEKIK